MQQVDVAPLDPNSPWRKPSGAVWFAEKGGDERRLVFKISIPDPGKKPKHLSLQLSVASKEITVRGLKDVALKYAPNMIMQLGPHRTVGIVDKAAQNVDLSAFWGPPVATAR